MSAKKANPLCSTCGLHESYAKKVNFMWAATWLILPIIGWTANDLYARNQKNVVAIASCKESSISRDIDIGVEFRNEVTRLERNDNTNERLLENVSMNLRIFMEAQGVSYKEPTKIRLGAVTDYPDEDTI